MYKIDTIIKGMRVQTKSRFDKQENKLMRGFV